MHIYFQIDQIFSSIKRYKITALLHKRLVVFTILWSLKFVVFSCSQAWHYQNKNINFNQRHIQNPENHFRWRVLRN